MKLTEAPRLPKLPFILGDLALLLLAAVIVSHHPSPWSPLPLLTVTACVIAGAIASFIPYLVNHVRDEEETNASLRHELGEQFKRLMVASEHLQHATVQLKAIEDSAVGNLQAVEALPQRLQEKIDGVEQQITESGRGARKSLEQELGALRAAENERLTALAERLAGLAAEWARLETDSRRHLADAARLQERIATALAAADEKIAALSDATRPSFHSPAPAPVPIPVVEPPAPPPVVAAAESPADPIVPSAPVEAVTFAAPAPAIAPNGEVPSAGAKPALKPRAPRRPKAGPVAAETSAEAMPTALATELVVEPMADDAPAPDDYSQVSAEDNRQAPAPSGDGLTRITVTSYVGIGNKLYLRGDGPGLNWEKGVPLQFISIGRWRWETRDVTAPFACKLYKNDKIEAPLGQLTVTPGTEQEIAATF